MRPTCINHGCNELCVYSHKDTQGNPRWRVHCSHCQQARYGKHPHRSGVTPYCTGKCLNHDGHLGYPCPTNYKKAPWAEGITEVDHKDGDCTNNDHDNLDELCHMCHKRKGKESGDYNNQKHNINKKKSNTNTIKANSTFNSLFYYDEADNDDTIEDTIEKDFKKYA